MFHVILTFLLKSKILKKIIFNQSHCSCKKQNLRLYSFEIFETEIEVKLENKSKIREQFCMENKKKQQ